MQAKIERGNDVNSVLFQAIGRVCYGKDTFSLEDAYRYLVELFPESPTYWFYKGGNHISVHSRRHNKRIALLSI